MIIKKKRKKKQKIHSFLEHEMKKNSQQTTVAVNNYNEFDVDDRVR